MVGLQGPHFAVDPAIGGDPPRGLILHTTVGIGYEVPWRQVEAMLHMAAERTPGVLKKPSPFVLHKALGDLAVTYELNVSCRDAREMVPMTRLCTGTFSMSSTNTVCRS